MNLNQVKLYFSKKGILFIIFKRFNLASSSSSFSLNQAFYSSWNHPSCINLASDVMDASKFQTIHWYFGFHCIEIHFEQTLKYHQCFEWASLAYFGSMTLMVLSLEAHYWCKGLEHDHSVCKLQFYQHRYDNNLLYRIELSTMIFVNQHTWASQKKTSKKVKNYFNACLEFFLSQQQSFTNY